MNPMFVFSATTSCGLLLTDVSVRAYCPHIQSSETCPQYFSTQKINFIAIRTPNLPTSKFHPFRSKY